MSDQVFKKLDLDLYHVLRGQIEHEDQLVNHRLSWLVSAQSFLLTAYAITLNAPLQFTNRDYQHINRMLFSLLPWAGLSVIGLIYVSIIGAILSLQRLHRQARINLPEGFPSIHGTNGTVWLGHCGPVLIPLVFAVVWLILVVSPNRG